MLGKFCSLGNPPVNIAAKPSASPFPEWNRPWERSSFYEDIYLAALKTNTLLNDRHAMD